MPKCRFILPAIVTALVVAAPANAAAASPANEIGAVGCYDGGLLRVNPPRSMSPTSYRTFRNPEMVRWSPDLLKWNGKTRRWRIYDSSRPFYRAFTSSYGYFQAQYQAAWQSPQNTSVMFVPFNNLPAGYYKVRNYLHWDQLGRTYYRDSAWCRFR